MSKLTKIAAVILLLLAASLAALAWWMGRREQTVIVPANAPMANSAVYANVVAARKLEKGVPITADSVKLLNLPTTIAGTYRDIRSVIGKIPATDIAAETLITDSNLVHGLALKLEAGERAVAIPIDEVAAAGNKIEAGDYVDVFFTLKQGTDVEKSQARLLASRRLVLAYGANVIGEAPGDSLPKNPSQNQARTAVLATPVDQVNPLLLAMQNGKLSLALRHPDDTGVADGDLFAAPKKVLGNKPELTGNQKDALKTADNQAFAGIDLSSWSGGNAKGTPVSPPPRKGVAGENRHAAGTLEVIKGTHRENVNF
ncbi:Flp pilus assembly protein CpaB [Herbaspirillum chlorophenolicum]|jgi:pilus assembly protein CpaB|uniref:Flp pilus assembly protein CpaB n=1 Tax=Herbaspirillum chlorophenolicum TaxID=211589 RepID=UPI0009E1A9A2|nr:Flp pilus assembly protein CpaB [Herbaspirillum chlorophenolicum]